MQIQNASVTGSETHVLERQINQLFNEVISVWRNSDIQKNEAVRRLAARLEEYYLQMGQPQEVQHISKRISDRLRDNGLEKTAHHVADFLDDKYKLDYSNRSHPSTGMILPKINIEEIIRKHPTEERTKEEIQSLHEYHKKLEHYIEENKQAAKARNIALDDDGDSLSKKKFDSVHTRIPDKDYRGPVYDELHRFVDELGRYHKDMEETLKDVNRWFDPQKVPEDAMIKVIEKVRGTIVDIRNVIAPIKDLKYATSMHDWFHTLIKYLYHGKHAGGVMTSIPSAQHFRADGTPEKRPLTREQVGDRVPYVEDLLERYADQKTFLDGLKAYLRGTQQWDRDDRVRRWRREFVERLVRNFADDGDFLNYLSFMREKLMNEEVAARRIYARETLSELA